MSRPLTILLIDPDVGLAARTRSFRGAFDYDIEHCADAASARERVARQPWDVVVATHELPDADGLNLLDELRQVQPRLKIALLVGTATLSTALDAINRVGVDHMLCKPFSAAQLGQVLDMLGERIEAERRHAELSRRTLEQYVALQTVNQHLDSMIGQRTLDLLNGLLAALEYRDSETQWHSRRVALYTHTMAWSMGVRGTELEDIQRGALLHDVGKIGIPDAILLKPGKLTAEEWDVMRTHCQLGHDLLGGIDFLHGARQLVLEHHERWDGGGYPRGLSGEAISLGARLFAIADTLDAMTSDRPYRKALPFEVAWDEIERQAGTQFDPAAVAAFQSIPKLHWQAAVAIGQAKERPEKAGAIPSALRRVWAESAFVHSFGDIDPARAWFQIQLDGEPDDVRSTLQTPAVRLEAVAQG